MMKFFAIESSLNQKFMGKIPQVKEFLHHCDVENETKFIDRFHFEEIKIQPILSNVVLFSDAKQTDFIDVYGNIGFISGYLISSKLKLVLDKYNTYGFQYFKTFIIQKAQKNENYWQTNIFDFPFQYIDFAKTTFLFKYKDINKNDVNEIIQFRNKDEFKSFADQTRYPKWVFFDTIFFNENMNLDFFSLRYTNGGHKGIVSERLKEEIEKQNCTGIEFRPIEISLNDWLKRDGPRDQIYGRSW